MGLPTSLAFLRTGTGGQTLDIYLDPLCPFSAKMARSLKANVVPLITKGGQYEGKLQLVVRPYPQPFHYFSTFGTEAILVFGNEHPDLFWEFLLAAFDIQDRFSNRAAATKTPQDAIQAYAEVAVQVLEKAGRLKGPASKVAGALIEELGVHEKNNGGSTRFLDLKYLIREGRQNGIHVTPTVLLNGLEDPSVSSSFGKDEWDKYFKEKL